MNVIIWFSVLIVISKHVAGAWWDKDKDDGEDSATEKPAVSSTAKDEDSAYDIENEHNSYDLKLDDIPAYIQKAVRYILSPSNDVWNEEIARISILLPLIDERLVKDYAVLIRQQLNTDVIMNFIRNQQNEFSSQKLARSIIGLKATCQSASNFYGINMLQQLMNHLGNHTLTSIPVVLNALCIHDHEINEILDRSYRNLETRTNAGSLQRLYDMEAYLLIVGACVKERHANWNAYLERKFTNTIFDYLRNVKGGDVYTEALMLQALNAWADSLSNVSKNEIEDISENLTSSLLTKQKEDGSFGDFLATYYALPALSGKSLFDLTKVNCSEYKKFGLIKEKPIMERGDEISIRLTISINRNSVAEENTITFTIPKGSTLLDALIVASSKNPLFEFKYDELATGKKVYELATKANDGEKRLYWKLQKYYTSHNHFQPVNEGIEIVPVKQGDHFKFTYSNHRTEKFS